MNGAEYYYDKYRSAAGKDITLKSISVIDIYKQHKLFTIKNKRL